MLDPSHPRTPRRPRAHRHGQGLRRPAAPARCRHARLRGAARPDDRPRGHRAREQAARSPPASSPACARPPSSRTSICRRRAASTGRCSKSSSPATGSTRTRTCSIIGPTGVGKSWIACALGHKACRDNRSVLYHRLPRLFDALALARGDGRYARLLKSLARVELLILDDWGLAPLTAEQRRDLWRSSTTGTGAARPSSPASFRSITGTRSSAIPPSPTPSSTVSSTTLTGSR